MGLWQRECDNVHRIELTVRGAIRPRQVTAVQPSLPAGPASAQPASIETRAEGLADASLVTRAQAATAAVGRGDTVPDNARDVLQGAALSIRNTHLRHLLRATPTISPLPQPGRWPPAAR